MPEPAAPADSSRRRVTPWDALWGFPLFEGPFQLLVIISRGWYATVGCLQFVEAAFSEVMLPPWRWATGRPSSWESQASGERLFQVIACSGVLRDVVAGSVLTGKSKHGNASCAASPFRCLLPWEWDGHRGNTPAFAPP